MCEGEQTEACDTSSRLSNELLNNEIRVSYDSDDMLAYAKKQAANARCSAPPRLLTSKKCKKLLSSCNKQPIRGDNKDYHAEKTDVSKQTKNNQSIFSFVDARRPSKTKKSPKQKSSINRTQLGDNNSEKILKKRKRKLLLPSQTISEFKQDSRESTPDLSNECPYKITPNKKQKTATASKNKTAKPMVLPPLMSIDWDSDDSLTRAARRESSALFVKKQKNFNSQRNIPTIVCTSLQRRYVHESVKMYIVKSFFIIEI